MKPGRFARFGAVVLALCPALALAGDATLPVEQRDPHSAQAFNAWLFAGPGSHYKRPQEYAELVAFLEERRVAGVVPAWQLLRTDADYAARCKLPAFAMPPRERWSQIVPVLRLVRDRVKPVVGRVEVKAAWRSPELNACVNGAKASRHLAFAAVDLVAPTHTERRKLFEDLCAMHARQGGRSPMGLGAYYDPSILQKNREGRFHIDASGYRSWGFDYSARSSGCRLMTSNILPKV